MGARRNRVWAWSAAAVALALIVGACSSGDDGQTDGNNREAVAALRSVGGLLVALQNERNVSSVSVIGMDDVLTYDVDLADARADTDESLARLARRDAARLYPSDAATTRTLTGLRADVDAALPGANISKSAVADGLFDRYSAIVDEYLGTGGKALLSTVDDPGLRDGIKLVDVAARLQDGQARMVRAILAPLLDSGRLTGSEQISKLSELLAEQQDLATELKATTRQPYRDLVESAFPEEQFEELTGIAQETLDGSPLEIPKLLDTVSLAGDDLSLWGLRELLLTALEEQVV